MNSPFVVNLYYAFQTTDKLCFILDLMNGTVCIHYITPDYVTILGGDLHYHLTQHGVFNEAEVSFFN